MFEYIYVEDAAAQQPLSQKILARFPRSTHIPCERYTEVFNRKAQNFRLQKQRPALILAHKHGKLLLPAPGDYGIGGTRNFYFSHMYNCVYDCRYCFLQGMYRSAHYVLFVNYHDFEAALDETINANPGERLHFFTGYDCDSLAFEPVTGFVRHFLPVFRRYPRAMFEIRSKSTQVRTLLSVPAQDNVVVACSFAPEETAAALEHRAPPPGKRLQAMTRLQQQGWRLGLRFDPLIYTADYRARYRRLFRTVFRELDPDRLHSVSLGSFRLPRDYFRTMQRLYPEERLFASPLQERAGMVTYRKDLHDEILHHCRDLLLQYLPPEKFFPCEEIS